jgi:hypothetical protein
MQVRALVPSARDVTRERVPAQKHLEAALFK